MLSIIFFLFLSLIIFINGVSICVIIADIITLSCLWIMRKRYKKQSFGVPSQKLHINKTWIDKVRDDIWILAPFIWVVIFLFIIFNIAENFISEFLSILYGTFLTVVTSTSVISIIKMNKEKIGWKILLASLITIFPILGKIWINEEEKLETIWFYSIYIAIVLIAFFIIIKDDVVTRIRGSKKIYKDLIYRTTNLKIYDKNDDEIIKHLENYCWLFSKYHNKLKNVKRIYFGTPLGIEKDYWFSWVAKRINIISLVCELLVFASAIIFNQLWILWFVGFFGIFYVLIYFIKIEDGEYLKWILVKLCYDDWGCFLEGSKIEFVGNNQMLEIGYKYRFVHEMLNITALCRVVASGDKNCKMNRMRLVTDNICELIKLNRKSKDWQWMEEIPLIISTMFEYNNTGTISNNARQLFWEGNFNNDEKREIQCFLQGLWATINGRMPTSYDGLFIRSFSNLLMNEQK